MTHFHNPYHFVPVGEADVVLSKADFSSRRLGHHTHGRFFGAADGIYTGRILCRLTAESPFFVGGRRTYEASSGEAPPRHNEYEPFLLAGEPALPASSLKGMVGSIVEAASRSTMRVLDDRPLSRRADFRGEALGAIGMIVANPDEKRRDQEPFLLRPLSLPPPRAQKDREGFHVNTAWCDLMPVPNFRVYLGLYRKGSTGRGVQVVPGTFAARHPVSWSSAEQQYWYMELNSAFEWDGATPGRVRYDEDSVRIKRGNTIVERSAPSRRPQPTARPECTRGLLRVLQVQGNESQIEKRWHEIFIPYTEEFERRTPLISVRDALAEFHALADEVTAEDAGRPFELAGQRRVHNPRLPGQIRLREDDLVFFDVETQDGESRASVVSISSIWRRSVGASVHECFAAIDPDLLPFHAGRSGLTRAELLLGFVGEGKGEPGLGLRGRATVSFGTPDPESPPVAMPSVALKALSSPKPPAPNLYFRNADGSDRAILKSAMRRDTLTGPERRHVPKGRKVYVHAGGAVASAPWQTRDDARPHLKNLVSPWARGSAFLFHVDFVNLDASELALLCYALRPAETFRHKLGMGKNIGLGTVCIDPLAILYQDPVSRYGKDDVFCDALYHGLSAVDGATLPDGVNALHTGVMKGPGFAELRGDHAKWLDAHDPDAARAIELLGDPTRVSHAVCTPLTMAQYHSRQFETETYKWFVANENQGGQHLRPLDKSSTKLPTLETN